MERKEPTFSGNLGGQHQIDDSKQNKPVKTQQPSAMPQKAKVEHGKVEHGKAPVAGKASGSNLGLIVAGVSLVMVALTFWQLQKAQNSLKDADLRIQQLEQALVMTGDESSQSVAALRANIKQQSEMLKKLENQLSDSNHEIRKLWDTRNVNKAGIADNKTVAQSSATQLKSVLTDLKAAKEQLITVKAEAKKALETSSEMSVAFQQNQKLVRELTDTKKSLESQVANLTARLKTNEEAIRSIDAFRKNTNSELWKLKQAQSTSAPTAGTQ